jgi:hypothetical protein
MTYFDDETTGFDIDIEEGLRADTFVEAIRRHDTVVVSHRDAKK